MQLSVLTIFPMAISDMWKDEGCRVGKVVLHTGSYRRRKRFPVGAPPCRDRLRAGTRQRKEPSRTARAAPGVAGRPEEGTGGKPEAVEPRLRARVEV